MGTLLLSTMAAKSSLRDRLVGAWELITYAVYSESSPDMVMHPLGEEAKGIIMYTTDGYMSAQLQRPGQKAFDAVWPSDGSESELAESAKKYIGYTGSFYLDESGESPLLYHRFNLSSFPNWLGQTQKRVMKMQGDDLILSLDKPMEISVNLPSSPLS